LRILEVYPGPELFPSRIEFFQFRIPDSDPQHWVEGDYAASIKKKTELEKGELRSGFGSKSALIRNMARLDPDPKAMVPDPDRLSYPDYYTHCSRVRYRT
jgi:hypothetical protein